MSNATSPEFIQLARLGRPFGVRGEIWLQVLTDRPAEVLSAAKEYRLLDGRRVSVVALLRHGPKWSWRLAVPAGEPDARGFAGRFTNAVVVATADELPARAAGELTEHEVIGMKVVDTTGRARGEIVRIERYSATDTWIVRDGEGREHDLLARKRFIANVDREARIVTVEPHSWVEG